MLTPGTYAADIEFLFDGKKMVTRNYFTITVGQFITENDVLYLYLNGSGKHTAKDTKHILDKQMRLVKLYKR